MSNNEPATIVAGTTAEWSVKYPAYPRSDGWALSFALNGPSGGLTGVTGTADPDDPDGWLITLTAAQTATLAPSRYGWQTFVDLSGVRHAADGGSMAVIADLAAEPAGYDTRSHARRTLDAIQAVIENRATKDQESYSIAGRSLSRIPLEQLLEFRNAYRAEVLAEERKERARNGEATGFSIKGVARRV